MTDDLRTNVDAALAKRLAGLGFKKARDGVFLRELGPDVSGWIGVGLATRKSGGEVDADPMVGVRYEPVERLMPSGANHDATVFRPLYEVLPGGDYQTWSFDRATVDAQADRLVEAMQQAAIPFIESLSSRDAIEEALTTWAFADVRRRRLPALRLAQGDDAGAQAELDRERVQLAEENDPAMRAEYDAFAQELLESRRR